MEQTQPSSRTIIGLVIGAIILVVGLLLISNAGGGGASTDESLLTQTRVALQPTATPESEPSPIPGERRDGEEDPDGDGFIGELDFCPDVAGAFEGCPDTDGDGFGDSKDACIDRADEGYGIDGTGCPNPAVDTDGDGVFDNDDTCPDLGDQGNGIDSVGCPIPVADPPPPTDTDGDGVFDDVDQCPTEGGGVVTVDETGCPIVVAVPDNAPAVMPYRFEGMGGMICTVTIVNVGDADPAILGEASGLVADGDGVIAGEISILLGANDTPEAQIGCVPDSAPAMMPYRFEGIDTTATCTVTVMNVGDGNPAVLGELAGLTADENGVLEGAISILIGANDTPETQLTCGIVGDPVSIGVISYDFELPADATCEVVIIDEGNVTVITIPATADENGRFIGTYEYDAQVVPNPRAELACAIVGDPVSIALFEYQFTGQPADAVMCDVVLFNEAGEQVAVIDALPNAEGVISGSYTYDPDQISPVRAEVFCALESSPPAPGMLEYEFIVSGNPTCEVVIIDEADVLVIRFPVTIGEGGIISGTYEYDPEVVPNPRAELACNGIELSEDAIAINMGTVGECQIIEGVAVAVFTLTNPNDIDINNGYTDQNGVAGEAYVPANGTSAINIIPNVDGFARIKFTGVSNFAEITGCVVVSEFTPDPELTPEVTPDPELTPEVTPDPELTPEVTPDPELTPEVTPEAPAYGLEQDVTCSMGETGTYVATFVITGVDAYPSSFNYQFTTGILGETDVIDFSTGSIQFIRTLPADATNATLVLIDETGYIWTFTADCLAFPSVYTVELNKYFNDYYETQAGGLNAPSFGSSGNAPDFFIDNFITATSSLGRAECDWIGEGKYLECTYFVTTPEGEVVVNSLIVPEGETFTVTEVPVEGWVTAYGTGTFSYQQCLANNIRTGSSLGGDYNVIGFCYHEIVNVQPNAEDWMLVDIDKEWLPSVAFDEGLSAPTEGGYRQFSPTFDVPNMIVVTSEYGTATCDWIALFGELECRINLTTRPYWYQYYEYLPVGPGGTYTVTENVPDGWTVVKGTGTFSLNTCADRYTYNDEYDDENGDEQEIEITECYHEVVNLQDETVLDGYYGVTIQKIWNDYEETALGGGLNSPVLGGQTPGPNQSHYNFITVTSSLGSGECHWQYWVYDNVENAYLDCYYYHYPNAPLDPSGYLLVPKGETYTVIERSIAGYVNVSGTGTFDSSGCGFEEIPAGYGYEYEFDIPVCTHTVTNSELEQEDFYRVNLQKYWEYNDYGGGLGAPAEGGFANGPLYDIPGFITAESSIGTATCDWDYNIYQSQLVCRYAPKDGQTMPDTAGLWVPIGETYTVSETSSDDWVNIGGVGAFGFDDCSNINGDVCYHYIRNLLINQDFRLLFVGKLWLNFECTDDFEGCYYEECEYYDDCYEDCFDCESNTGGLNAPASGGFGFETVGPNIYIDNLITVTSSLGSMTCDWVPSYYDIYYQTTYGYLACQVTSMAEGYPPIPFGLWIGEDGMYTVTENTPEGYVTVYGTGTFSTDECYFSEGPKGDAGNTIPVGDYYENRFECFHLVANDTSPDVTPTPTPDVTATPDVTPEVTLTPEVTTTPDVTPEVTTTPETPPDVTPELPTEVVTEEPTGDCGAYGVDADGFPIINLSSRFCGGDVEGQIVNFAPIETGGDVCIPEALYHSNANGTWDIFSTAADTAPENLTNGVAGVISMAPTRSPNGRYVAFVSNADGDWEIYLLDLDGDNKLMQLTNNELAIDLDPVFSPSGRFIAYESNVDGNWEIRLIDLSTGEKSRITRHPANDINPFWHPDGDKIAFQSDRTGTWQIFEAENIGGENRVRLLSDGTGNDFDPTYSHDGERIAFRSERNGETGIYVMDADGTNVMRISPVGMNASTPVWAEGDRYIAYQATEVGASLNDIYVYDVETGETRLVTANDDDMANTQDVAPTWLCNSFTLIFASDVSGNNRIYAVPALPMDAPPTNLLNVMSWTENEFNNRDPQNTPSEENGSRMGALPPRFNP